MTHAAGTRDQHPQQEMNQSRKPTKNQRNNITRRISPFMPSFFYTGTIQALIRLQWYRSSQQITIIHRLTTILIKLPSTKCACSIVASLKLWITYSDQTGSSSRVHLVQYLDEVHLDNQQIRKLLQTINCTGWHSAANSRWRRWKLCWRAHKKRIETK